MKFWRKNRTPDLVGANPCRVELGSLGLEYCRHLLERNISNSGAEEMAAEGVLKPFQHEPFAREDSYSPRT